MFLHGTMVWYYGNQNWLREIGKKYLMFIVWISTGISVLTVVSQEERIQIQKSGLGSTRLIVFSSFLDVLKENIFYLSWTCNGHDNLLEDLRSRRSNSLHRSKVRARLLFKIRILEIEISLIFDVYVSCKNISK